MTSIESVTLEVSDPTAALASYTGAFGVGTQVGVRAADAPTTGFRGFTNLARGVPAEHRRYLNQD
jgi:hypothetical protein